MALANPRASFVHFVRQHHRLLVMPLMGCPGIQLHRSTIKQNLFNWDVQFRTLSALAERFKPDGIFTFMDWTVEAGALGLPVEFPLDAMPRVAYSAVRSRDDLGSFYNADILKDGRVVVFVETVRLLASRFNALVGAYVTGPYTLAALMLGEAEAARAVSGRPSLLQEALALCTPFIVQYARALADAGASLIVILEPCAAVLSPKLFRTFSGYYLRQIVEQLPVVPVLHIGGDIRPLIPAMLESGVQGLILDSSVRLPEAAAQIPSDVVLFGNLGPARVILNTTPAAVYAQTRALVQAMAPYPNFILSTGCDLPPETPLLNIQALIDAGRE